jgi:hypothetical protein
MELALMLRFIRQAPATTPSQRLTNWVLTKASHDQGLIKRLL